MSLQQSPHTFRRTLMAGSILAMGLTLPLAAPSFAQEEAAAETITVTASRVRTSGFSAPTPLTVVGESEFQAIAPVDVSEALFQIPQFGTSSQPSTAVSYANLRSIGAERTLLLLDGRRHVPTFSSGVVDLTTIPTALISRTEVVTGGASASWGSDAVAGVVNLILDSDIEGIKGNVQGGISDYGDDESYSVSLAGGFSFAGGRGHLIAGGEYAKADGIGPLSEPGDPSRPWAGRASVANNSTTNGLPQLIYADDVRSANTYDGGIITSGPLRGTIFLPNGQTGQFGYGQVFGTSMIGGTDNALDIPGPQGQLKYPYERTSFLTRATFELTPALEVFAEFNYSRALSQSRAILGQNAGSVGANAGCTRTSGSGNVNVHISNAFLPDSVVQQMVDAGITCFNFGRTHREEGIGMTFINEGSPDIYRGVFGLNGELGGGWSWDAYVQHGEATFQQRRGNNIHVTRYQAAIDAVRDPVSGQIVCRINIDANPANDDPACVPFNLFGAGSPSPAAQDYVTGTSRLDQDIEQTVAAVNIYGDLFDLWAGPISMAAGAEYRKESIFATVDPDSELNLWRTSNRKGIEGSYDVQEVYGELAVPLLRDAPLAQALDLNIAARYTDYSSSGGVTTWKIGGTWDLNDQIRLRATQSRDIRAGNLGELFTPTAVALVTIFNPSTSAIDTPVQVTTSGNPTLDPEEADTFTAGVVYSPGFFPGFQASVDYYSIDIQGQIDTISGQQITDLCFEDGLQEYCNRIDVNSLGVITAIDNSFANLDRFETSGVDIEMRYNFDLADIAASLPGSLGLRVLSTYVDERRVTYLTDGSSEDTAGQFTTPNWKVFALANYQVGDFGMGVDWRWYGGGKLDNDRVEGGTGAGTANINDLASVHYTSLNFTYDLPTEKSLQVFARVDNVFDKNPPFPLLSAFNDNYGRGYRAGLRFEF